MADNRVAYGLAKKYGIDTKGMSPKEVWEALKEKGVTERNVADGAYDSKANKAKELAKKAKGGSFINVKLFANKNLSKMGRIQLEKSIKSYKKRISEHKEYLKNPTLKYPKEEWDSFSIDRKERELGHWEKEIDSFSKVIKEIETEITGRNNNE